MQQDLWVPIVLFVSVAVSFCFLFYFRYRARLATQETIRIALEKGTELDPEFIKELTEPQPHKDRDLRRGLIWIALGIGMLLLSFGVNEPDAIGPMMGSAAFPGLIGVAYLIMWVFSTRKE